jgi:rRNA biogenesis protein RRP5
MKNMTTEKKDEDEEEDEENEEEEDEDEDGMEVEDENDEDENDDNKKKKSKNKEKDNLKKEIAIREIEKANENDEIKNGQYYERLILKDHDNSINWIAYASYILDTLNLASSRKIFERALKVVDIAKTNEKFNLWIAYLNLENVYGDKKSFQKILDRAKEVCDKKLLYSHLIKIYMDSKKYEDASDLYKLLIKDYFNDLEIWKKYIEFLFQIQKLKSGDEKGDDNAQISDMSNLEIIEPKEGLDKSIQVLPKKTHLDIMSWYGQLLYINGNNEEARNMFDNILKNFPKRKDIWFVYIDKEVKYGNIDKVRQIFDKMFEVKFKINDLKSVMKKFLEFEKKHCKDEKEFVKAQEKTKSILEKRMGQTESKNKKENEEEENDEEDDE